MSEDLCFCGSALPQKECHGHIHKHSVVAELYRLQHELDEELERAAREDGAPPPSGPERGNSCSRLFYVSEAEFVQILDFLRRTRTREELLELIAKAKRQWKTLCARDPGMMVTLECRVPLEELLWPSPRQLPFPCLFLEEDGRCAVEQVRPVSCRLHDLGRDPALRLPPPEGGLPRFLFFRWKDRIIFRRPAPLFYFFRLIFADESFVDRVAEADFFRNMLCLDEEAYVRSLVGPVPPEKKPP